MTGDSVPWSGEWIRRQTDEGLQNVIDGTMPGPHLDALVAGLRYREAKERGRKSDERAESDHAWVVATFWVAFAGVLVTLAVGLLPLSGNDPEGLCPPLQGGFAACVATTG